MNILTTSQAAERLGVSVRRIQQLVKDGRLPAKEFGGSLMIEESDLKLVEDRKPGRPKGSKRTANKEAPTKESVKKKK